MSVDWWWQEGEWSPAWGGRRPVPPTSPPPIPNAPMALRWGGRTNQSLVWSGIVKTQYRIPIRRTVPQQLQYTFLDEDDVAIPLTGQANAYLEIKEQDGTFVVLPALFVDQSHGVVGVPNVTFDIAGVWQAQFYCVDGNGDRIYGEPIQFTVVPNVDDLTAGQLMVY